MPRTLATVLVFTLLVGCNQVASLSICTTSDGKRVVDVLQQYTQEWDDTTTLASNSPRMSLAGPVSQLQRIRRELQGQKWPECARRAQSTFVLAMDAEIEVFTDFMGQRSSGAVNWGPVERRFWDYSREFASLSGGATPRPLPTVDRAAAAGTVTAATTAIANIGITMTAISATSNAITRSVAGPPATPTIHKGSGSDWLTSARATAFASPP